MKCFLWSFCVVFQFNLLILIRWCSTALTRRRCCEWLQLISTMSDDSIEFKFKEHWDLKMSREELAMVFAALLKIESVHDSKLLFVDRITKVHSLASRTDSPWNTHKYFMIEHTQGDNGNKNVITPANERRGKSFSLTLYYRRTSCSKRCRTLQWQ